MKKKILFVCTFLCTLLAFGQVAEKSTVGITKVQATPSLTAAVKAAGKISTMNRVLESIDANLSSSLQSTRKFEVILIGNLPTILEGGGLLESGLVGSSGGVMLKDIKYGLIVSVDDFQDQFTESRFPTLLERGEKRVLRFGAVASVYDMRTGSLIETANFIVSNKDAVAIDETHKISGGSSTDALIALLARDMCDKLAFRVADIIYPAKVIAKTGKTVSFNRTDATGVVVGDEYEVFALGEAMIDPDTGENLGSEEISVGKMRVISVNAKFSRGILLEDYGADKGHVLRLTKKVEAPAPVFDDGI